MRRYFAHHGGDDDYDRASAVARDSAAPGAGGGRSGDAEHILSTATELVRFSRPGLTKIEAAIRIGYEYPIVDGDNGYGDRVRRCELQQRTRPVVSTASHDRFARHQKEGPLVLTRGELTRVVDDGGNSFIEGVSGLWSVSLGFHNERLARAAYGQMLKLPSYHMFRFKSHEPGIELAERLLGMAPVPMSKVFFANSGSEANDTAIKLVWYYNNALGRRAKKKIIARRGGYHG